MSFLKVSPEVAVTASQHSFKFSYRDRVKNFTNALNIIANFALPHIVLSYYIGDVKGISVKAREEKKVCVSSQ